MAQRKGKDARESEAEILRRQPGLRMMERVVPMGSSFFGWGTMAMRPAAFLYLAWLPFCVANKKPCCWSTRMTSAEPSRSGVHHLQADADVRDSGERRRCFTLEVKFDGLLEVGESLFAGGPEAGHIHVEALGDEKFIFPIHAIGHCFHDRKANTRDGRRQRRRIKYTSNWICARPHA